MDLAPVGKKLPSFRDHTWEYVVMEGHPSTTTPLKVWSWKGAYPSTTTCTNVVVKGGDVDSYLHVMPPRFSSTTNIGFLVVNYVREKSIF